MGLKQNKQQEFPPKRKEKGKKVKMVDEFDREVKLINDSYLVNVEF